jgi:hypothetical protein
VWEAPGHCGLLPNASGWMELSFRTGLGGVGKFFAFPPHPSTLLDFLPLWPTACWMAFCTPFLMAESGEWILVRILSNIKYLFFIAMQLLVFFISHTVSTLVHPLEDATCQIPRWQIRIYLKEFY